MTAQNDNNTPAAQAQANTESSGDAAKEKIRNKFWRPARAISAAALIVLISLACGRVLINETPAQRGPLMEAGAYSQLPVDQQVFMSSRVMRVASAMIILLAALGYAISVWAGGTKHFKAPRLMILTALTCVLMAIPLAASSDMREASVTTLEQVSLLISFMLIVQLADRPWRRRLVWVAVCAICATLAVKAIHQVTVEIPEQAAYFNAHRAEQLAALGMVDGTPDAEMMEARIVERTAKGYFSLANLFGSLMLMISAAVAGLALDQLRLWLSQRKSGRQSDRKGELPLSLISAIGCGAISAAGVFACVATQSKGAIACCAFAFIAAAVFMPLRNWAAKNRGKLIAVGVIATLAAIAATIAYGTKTGTLPSRSMQVRWEYWVGSAKLAAQHPLTGVGAGNFADAYLAVRPIGAEESVKNPHNLIAHALSEYGLPAGGAFVLTIAAILIAACSPRDKDTLEITDANDNRLSWIAAAAAVAGAIALKTLSSNWPNSAVYITQNFIAIAALPAAAIAGLWATTGGGGAAINANARENAPKTSGEFYSGARVFAICGLAAFVLHNLTDFALFKPAAAMVFYMLAAAVISQSKTKTACVPRVIKITMNVVALIAIIVATTAVLSPVTKANRHCYAAARNFSDSRLRSSSASERMRLMDTAITQLDAAAAADKLDSLIPCDTASLCAQLMQAGIAKLPGGDVAATALNAARSAHQRDPRSVRNYEMLLRVTAMVAVKDIYALPSVASVFSGDAELANRYPPQSPQYLNAVAVGAGASETDTKSRQQATELLKKACQKFGNSHPALISNYGDALYLTGNVEAARTQWQLYSETVNATSHVTPNEITGDISRKKILKMAAELAARDPYDPYKRLWLAELCWRLGDARQSAENAAAARTANEALFKTSVMRFNPHTLNLLKMLETRSSIAWRRH